MPSPSAVILDSDEHYENGTALALFVIIWFVWIILGFSGLIYSLVCTSKSGTPGMQALGILIAVLLGPFYWIFYAYNKNYCR